MEWTREQRGAIGARGTNILLSAAAGSGKTTVLVERVLQLIREGVDVDRMLIVTFTRAASADMRAKLARELGSRAAEGDERCRNQQLLLERASISTLHSFCADFLRSHFECAGIDPAFRVLDDAEVRRLFDEALDEAIEEAYAAVMPPVAPAGDNMSDADEPGGFPPRAGTDAEAVAANGAAASNEETDAPRGFAGISADPEWKEAFMALDYARGPKRVRAMTELLLRYLDERPDPEAWLARACAPDAGMRAAWLNELVTAALTAIQNALTYARTALAHPDCNGNYAPALEEDIEELSRLADMRDAAELQRALKNFRLAAPGRRRGEPPISDEFKNLRDSIKKEISGTALSRLDMAVALQDVEALTPQLCVLRDIALRAKELFEARKAELAGLSYSDLEHRTLRALRDEAVAAELRERYEHIFVDEYQDTSDVQDALIARITRGNNLFMVGDVKQSIYRFRQAEPRLFMEKYARYGRGEGGTLLPLTMNFRSRPAILAFVNRVFERAMHGESSEILYDDMARLNHGNKELEGGNVELHLLTAPRRDDDIDDEIKEMAVCEREALFIAGRIRALMAEDEALRYRDIAILTRTKQGVLGRMAAVLLQEDIPAYADGSEAFYDSVEVTLALSMLRLTANGRNDIELTGVLRSPVVGLTLDELARVRAAFPVIPFSDAVARFADGTDELAIKLRDFLLMLERWRLMALCCDLGKLTRAILDESGLYDCVGALPGGPQRQANLDRLVDNAAAFDRNISGSLTRFLRHCEKLRARGDGDEAHVLGEGDDVVRLMTVHKSKGLEFPVVFGAMMERGYNNRGGSAGLIAHRDLGMGCLYCDPALQSRRKTLPQLAIAERRKREDHAEELRILYVLLTRARDRLILVGSVKNPEAAKLRWSAMRDTPDAAGNYLDVILPALSGADGLCDIRTYGPNGDEAAAGDEEQEADAPDEAKRDAGLYGGAAAPASEDHAPELPEPDPGLVRALLWRYPLPDVAYRPLKLTVTGLLREIQSPDALEPLIERPDFMNEEAGGMSGTERGTAYHRAMQLLDLGALRALSGKPLLDALRVQLEGFVAEKLLSPAQRDVIELRSIARFLESPLGTRLRRADEVRREWSFNAMMNISAALTPEEARGFGTGDILVQGKIDCCFLEGDSWVLIDYKTDRSNDAAALTLRYRDQLRLYAGALRDITETPVAEIWLCLLHAGESILIPGRAEE